MSQMALQQSARRIALKRPFPFTTSRLIAPSNLLLHIRPATISHSQATQVPQDKGLNILEHQRLQRPVSPHLSIYKPQITWIPSIMNRITGCILSGALYIFAAGYAAAPLLGWQWGSAAMAAGFAKWPLIAKVVTKSFFALPFTFHGFNGIRHLVWDTGATMTNPQVAKTGWAVIGISVASAVGLVLFL